jgi:hypothetical protein
MSTLIVVCKCTDKEDEDLHICLVGDLVLQRVNFGSISLMLIQEKCIPLDVGAAVLVVLPLSSKIQLQVSLSPRVHHW